VINRRFPYLHIAFILLLSIVFIPPAFAIEARYVKILIDGAADPESSDSLVFQVSLFDVDGNYINVFSLGSYGAFLTGSQLQLVITSRSGQTVFLANPYRYAFFSNPSLAYYCMSILSSCWVMVDLLQPLNIGHIELSTYDGFKPFLDTISSSHYDYWVSSVGSYRVLTSNDNLNWTLAAVVTDKPAGTRTDTITLEDLGGGMDIDINYVIALMIAIVLLGFFRQIFF
jgi:hypothetical protein